jgi:hypothetical protein
VTSVTKVNSGATLQVAGGTRFRGPGTMLEIQADAIKGSVTLILLSESHCPAAGGPTRTPMGRWNNAATFHFPASLR